VTLPTKIKRVLLHPDPRLAAPNAEVVESWDELEPWVRLMWKALRNNWTCAVGLAAPQVGWNVRLFITDTDTKEHKPENRRVFWNPEILNLEGEAKVLKEGCLSLPQCWAEILRYPKVYFRAQTPRGAVQHIFDGLDAQVVQHEMDHLAGRCIVSEHVIQKAEAR
jgi:peptide deformylase